MVQLTFRITLQGHEFNGYIEYPNHQVSYAMEKHQFESLKYDVPLTFSKLVFHDTIFL